MTLAADRTAVLIATAVVLAGLLFVVRPFEEQVAQRYRALDEFTDVLSTRDAIARQGDALERERRSLRAELGGFHFEADATTTTARLLERVASIAARRHIHVSAIADQQLDAAPRLQVTLRGTYAPTIAAIRDVLEADVPIDLGISSISSTGAGRVETSPDLLTVLSLSLVERAERSPHALRSR